MSFTNTSNAASESPIVAVKSMVPQTDAPRKPDNDTEGLTARDLLPSQPDIKGQRAFERERQRVKKVADTTKMRAQKLQQSPSGGGGKFSNTLGTGLGAKGRLLRAEDFDTLDGIVVEPARGDYTPPARNDKPEVKLADLISTAHKARGRTDAGFEVIPHIRSVIVLDDIMTHDLTIDEPWEHIHGVNDDDGDDDIVATKAPSYAKVLSSPRDTS